ncbi:hypothetical protein A3C37_05325 [Candidatus Peribacteria bacterium RIFCSPHIGHO2_02_FULL_53_20]|nr:MAG: hypothetical protein A3C37_05325 [Candidatus Peribacteria bacterium RIFCSPHIGHO2_02_FULL_53_20]OGJ68252.1 MAG: hypothetical protein A3B61_03760 [Candidatus Peribacteria bacterium RIFCSPLOWO2_01_FULL_53_10]
MKRFIAAGVLTGLSALALAAPIAGAQGVGSSASAQARVRPSLTQENVQKMIDKHNKFLTNIDAVVSLFKNATTTHRDALVAASNMTDATARKAAVKSANEAYRTTIQNGLKANPDLKFAMHFGLNKEGRGSKNK